MNIIAKLDEWYKEWRGHSHINDINQQIFDSADCQDFARLCVENALSERQETTEAEPHGSKVHIADVSNCDAIFEQDAKLTQEEIEEDCRNIPN